MKREDLKDSKWDIKEWTHEQKVKWQNEMLSLGFVWRKNGNNYLPLDTDVKYLKSHDYDLTLSYIPDFEEHPNKPRVYTDLFPESKKEDVKEDYINTKWDASQWSKEQKTKWQEYMLVLGFQWCWEGKSVQHLDKDYYFIRTDKELTFATSYKYYGGVLELKECFYEDVFPNEEPVSKNSVEFEFNGNSIEAEALDNLDLFNKLLSITKNSYVTFTIDKGLIKVSSESLGLDVVVDSTEGLEKVLETLEFLQQKQLTPEPLISYI